MSRLKSSSYEGSSLRDTSVDSSILTRTMRKAAEDLAMIFDRITGENGETLTINHSGSGRGAPLGMPLISQYIGRRFAQPLGMSEKFIGDTYLLLAPVRVVDGCTFCVLEAEIDFIVASAADSHLDVVVFDAGVRRSVPYTINEDGTIVAPVAFGSTGIHLVGIIARPRLTSEADSFYLHSWRVYPVTSQTSHDVGGPPSLSTTYDVAPTIDETTGIDSAQIVDDGPLDAKVLVDVTRWLQAMTEYVLGGPLPGNETRTVTQEWDHDHSVFSNEPVPIFNVFAECLGAIVADGAPVVTDGLVGATDWCAPFLLVAAPSPGKQAVARKQVYLPDFEDTTQLRCFVLASSKGAPTAWKADVLSGIGTSSLASFASLSGPFFTAEIDSIPFDPGALNDLQLRIQSDAAVAHGELQVIGWCIYFED